MRDEPSPWPERPRTQALLFAAGAACMLPSAVQFGGLAELGGTFVVGTSAVGSALLIYGLLGWGGQWAAPDEDVAGGAADDDELPDDTDDELPGDTDGESPDNTDDTSPEDTPDDPSDPGDGDAPEA